MHLGSYLGYLIGKECAGQDEECKIVVISKDTGFDHIIEFWKTEKDVKVSRNEKISGKQVHTRKQVKKQTGKENSWMNNLKNSLSNNQRIRIQKSQNKR